MLQSFRRIMLSRFASAIRGHPLPPFCGICGVFTDGFLIIVLAAWLRVPGDTPTHHFRDMLYRHNKEEGLVWLCACEGSSC